MKRYSISARGMPTIDVPATNWIVALGIGLERLGQADAIARLACEVLPNGTVIARDIQSGTGFVVHAAAPIEEASTLDDVDLADIDQLGVRLEEIGEASSSTFACQIALETAQELLPAESGSVILEQDGYLRFIAAVGPFAPRLVGVRLPLGTGVAGFSMQKRQPVVLGDASVDPRHCAEMDRLTGYQTRQMACLPVVDDGRHCHGVLEVMNLPSGERFSRDAVHQLQKIATSLGERLAQV
jgi:GAF domain-containing protein